MRVNVVEVEKPSSIVRKMTISVPSEIVRKRIDESLASVQKTATLKGFRPGQAPISIIKQYYGDDVRHRVFHTLIDESFDNVVKEQKLKPVGSPKIDTPEHKTGEGAHDHTLHEDKPLTYVATFEIFPEIKVKKYSGLSLTRTEVDVTDDQLEEVVSNLRNSQAQLTPVEGDDRAVQQGDFADIQMQGGVVVDGEVHPRDDMKGNQVIEVGSTTGWIPGFTEELVGVKKNESKTFRLTFPTDYFQTELANKVAEFTITVNDIKEKKQPELDDEFAKQMGYEGLSDLRTKAKEYLTREKTEESDRLIRSELVGKLIEDNAFDVPGVMIESQTRGLAQDLSQELKKQGYQDKAIQEVLMQEIGNLKKRAESQVRASLILEAIATEENVTVASQDLKEEMARMAISMNVDESKVQEFYTKNSGRQGDLEFRLRQERTIKLLLDKAKIKSAPPKEK